MRQDDLARIGARLTLIRGSRPQSVVAELVGVHKNTIGTYERGEREIGALALAGYVAQGWSSNWILTGEGPERLDSQTAQASQSLRLDRGRLRSASRLLEMALDMADREITADRRVAVLADLYEWLADHGDALTPDNLVDFNAYLSARIKTGVSDEGRGDRQETG